MTTPTFVQAVPWDMRRIRRAVALQQETGGTIVWDQNHSAIDTWLRVMEAIGDGPGILIEDDAHLAPTWREGVEETIAEFGDDVIKFYGTSPIPGMVKFPGKTFAVNVCVYYPPGMAADFLQWSSDRQPSKFSQQYHDMWFGSYLHLRRASYWEHVPSLVQHERWPSVVMENRSRKRQSPTFGKYV